MRPGNFILLLAFLLTSSVSAQTLTYRINNMSVVNSATDSLVFDIELKASAGGTYIRSLQVAINYNTAAFGSNIASNVGVRKRTLCDGNSGGLTPQDFYNASVSNNTSSRIVVFVLSNFTTSYFPGVAHKEPTTTYQKLVRVAIPITDTTELPKISLEESAMSGQQFHQLSDNSPSSYNSPIVANSGNGLAFPLQNFDIIWDGATWSGGSAGGAPSSSDNTLDMLVETATTDPMPGNATVQRLIILDSSILDLGGNTLTITGELIGSVSGQAINGTIELAGAAAQTITGDTEWENLTINNSNGVAIDGGTQTVTGVFTPTDGTITTNGNLLLASTSASSYGQIAAEGGGASISGDVTFQMVISEPGWHNLGSPISGMTLDDLEDDIIINYSGNSSGVSAYYWDAATADFIAATDSSDAFTGGWNIYIDSNFVRAGGGVNGDGNLPVVLDLTGSINTGNTTSSLGYTSTLAWSDYADEGASDGWNLIANPYPSNLDWSKVDDNFSGSDYSDTYYIWKQSLNSGDGGYVAWNSVAGSNGGVSNIAPLQAVWVKLNNSGATATNVFDFTNSDRTTSSPATHLKNQEKLVLEIVRNSNPDYSDNVVFVRELGFSLNQDTRGDITKFYNPAPQVMNFYSITPDSAVLAANVIDRSFYGDTAFLGVKGNLLEDYTISIAENTFPQDFIVKLYDRKTGVTTDLLNNSYTFTNDTAFDEHRFDLIAVANDISVEENGASGQRAFRVRVDNGVINVDFLEGLSPEVIVEVIDMSGRQLYSEDDISTYGPLQFQFKKPLNDVSYYILRVIDEDNNMAYSEKFLY
ncbi:MAG: hypothetical protein HWD92_12025 [Flavobacteriia bacterium]|nr:hypothetical protein [Flavobacteriia bacterium]